MTANGLVATQEPDSDGHVPAVSIQADTALQGYKHHILHPHPYEDALTPICGQDRKVVPKNNSYVVTVQSIREMPDDWIADSLCLKCVRILNTAASEPVCEL